MVKAEIICSYKLSKAGNSEDECEDAYSTNKTKKSLMVFIADGATESSFSREWAILLSENLIKNGSFSSKGIITQLPKIRKEWKNKISIKSLPWYAEMKLQKGAYSTVLGLQINYKKSSFNCSAIGDCCTFHLRSNNIISSFPIENESEFLNNPFLVSTNVEDDKKLREHFQEIKDQKIRKGDYLFVMSDALAHWFMTAIKANKSPWNALIQFTKKSLNSSFEEWLEIKRNQKEIKNDDTTLLIIEIL